MYEHQVRKMVEDSESIAEGNKERVAKTIAAAEDEDGDGYEQEFN